jgi:hypothetical protein
MTTHKYKFITVKQTAAELNGKLMWSVNNNRSDEMLAVISWDAKWKQYIVDFRPDTIWSKGCLVDVADALTKIGTP